MATVEELSWRRSIIDQLHERNKLQTRCFEEIITQNNKLFDNANTLRSENLQLSIQNEKLKAGPDASSFHATGADPKLLERLQYLEKKVLTQQEELTELHRRKGENVQQIIDLNVGLKEKEKALSSKEASLEEALATNTKLRAEIKLYEKNIKEMDHLNQVLRDEHQALQLAFNALEEKLREVQNENTGLLEKLISYKEKDAEKMNEENDNFLKKRNAKMQKEIEDACRDTRGLSPEDIREGAGPTYHCSSVPTGVYLKFDAHEGEVNAVKWSPVDRLMVTGGADRKVKLWDVSKGQS